MGLSLYLSNLIGYFTGFPASPSRTRKDCAATGAFDAGEVPACEHCGVSRFFQQGAATLGLVVAVLEGEPAARGQVLGRAGDDGADASEPVGACDKRRSGLEAQIPLREVRIARGDVGRVGDDQIETAAAERGKPVA